VDDLLFLPLETESIAWFVFLSYKKMDFGERPEFNTQFQD
jgi:hypothetical protein